MKRTRDLLLSSKCHHVSTRAFNPRHFLMVNPLLLRFQLMAEVPHCSFVAMPQLDHHLITRWLLDLIWIALEVFQKRELLS
jgi:hypothetical protein